MNAAHEDDRDWLFPEPAPPSVPPPPPEDRPGCWRFDHQCDRPQAFGTLSAAIVAGPPMDPGATIESKGVVLAYAAEDRAEWITTDAGKARIDHEAYEAERKRALREVA